LAPFHFFPHFIHKRGFGVLGNNAQREMTLLKKEKHIATGYTQTIQEAVIGYDSEPHCPAACQGLDQSADGDAPPEGLNEFEPRYTEYIRQTKRALKIRLRWIQYHQRL
jgi:hypothetical protein